MRFERTGAIPCRTIINILRAERQDAPLPVTVRRPPMIFSDQTVQTIITVMIGVLIFLAVGGLVALLVGLGDPR